jgi:CHASE3 domain sensor protein
MSHDRLKTLCTLSVRKRIFGGFAVVLALLMALAGVSFHLMVPLDAVAARVREDSAKADAASAISQQVADAHAHVVQYALSANGQQAEVLTTAIERLVTQHIAA